MVKIQFIYSNTQYTIFLWIYNRNARNNSPHLGIFIALQTIGGLNSSVDCKINYWIVKSITRSRSTFTYWEKKKRNGKKICTWHQMFCETCFRYTCTLISVQSSDIKIFFFPPMGCDQKFDSHCSHLRTLLATDVVTDLFIFIT